jgi:hypothetical protein
MRHIVQGTFLRRVVGCCEIVCELMERGARTRTICRVGYLKTRKKPKKVNEWEEDVLRWEFFFCAWHHVEGGVDRLSPCWGLSCGRILVEREDTENSGWRGVR